MGQRPTKLAKTSFGTNFATITDDASAMGVASIWAVTTAKFEF